MPDIHLALVVPDARLAKLLADHVYVIGPTTYPARVTCHVLTNDAKHAAARLDHYMRWALVETGLFTPERVGFIGQAQVELGWPTHEARKA